MALERITVQYKLVATTAATPASHSLKNNSRRNVSPASTKPTIRLTRNSFHSTLKKSLNCTWLSARPRITSVEACAPQLPPVSISMGM